MKAKIVRRNGTVDLHFDDVRQTTASDLLADRNYVFVVSNWRQECYWNPEYLEAQDIGIHVIDRVVERIIRPTRLTRWIEDPDRPGHKKKVRITPHAEALDFGQIPSPLDADRSFIEINDAIEWIARKLVGRESEIPGLFLRQRSNSEIAEQLAMPERQVLKVRNMLRTELKKLLPHLA